MTTTTIKLPETLAETNALGLDRFEFGLDLADPPGPILQCQPTRCHVVLGQVRLPRTGSER